MELHKKCSACKKLKLAFFVRKRTYIGKGVPTGKVTSDTDICKYCHENAQILILGRWSLRHRIEYAIMRIRTIYDSLRNKKTQ